MDRPGDLSNNIYKYLQVSSNIFNVLLKRKGPILRQETLRGRGNRRDSNPFPSTPLTMAVPQRTLNWLYSVLSKVGLSKIPHIIGLLKPLQDHYDPQQTYRDPNRTYHDVANALAQYPSLSPRTDVYSECLKLILMWLLFLIPNSLRDRLLGPPPSPGGHIACHLPRNHIQISHCALDSKYIPTRASNCLCDPDTGYGCPSWATCDARGTGVPPLSGTLG